MMPLRVFIGYDAREPLALEVCAFSINRRASAPVSIIPLNVNHLKGIYTRGANGTTAFSLTRFLVPYLSGFEGMSIFCDCDMLVQTDIYDVFKWIEQCEDYRDYKGFGRPAVWACQHNYVPKDCAKATGMQSNYPRKNWSSFMVFDNARCDTLTPDYVNSATPQQLHRFEWTTDVGALPLDWNWLVGEYEPNPDARNLHFTLGTPCFNGFRESDHADLWFAEYEAMNVPLVVPSYGEPYAVAAAAGYPVPPRTA
jgi:hypothetical protein